MFCVVISEMRHQNRRVDIIIFDRLMGKSLVLNPTICCETNNMKQDEKVNEEKSSIYLPTIPYLQ